MCCCPLSGSGQAQWSWRISPGPLSAAMRARRARLRHRQHVGAGSGTAAHLANQVIVGKAVPRPPGLALFASTGSGRVRDASSASWVCPMRLSRSTTCCLLNCSMAVTKPSGQTRRHVSAQSCGQRSSETDDMLRFAWPEPNRLSSRARSRGPPRPLGPRCTGCYRISYVPSSRARPMAWPWVAACTQVVRGLASMLKMIGYLASIWFRRWRGSGSRPRRRCRPPGGCRSGRRSRAVRSDW